MTAQYPYPADRFTLVGTVTRSHGLKGDFKVSPRRSLAGDVPETFEEYSRAALVAADGRMTALLDIERCRVQGKKVILKLDTIDSKNEADLIVSMGVLIANDDLTDLNKELAELPQSLIGSSVVTTDGSSVGELVDIGHSGGPGAHRLLIIAAGSDEYLVPLVDEIVVSMDDGRIVIDPPEGLLEINQPEQGSK